MPISRLGLLASSSFVRAHCHSTNFEPKKASPRCSSLPREGWDHVIVGAAVVAPSLAFSTGMHLALHKLRTLHPTAFLRTLQTMHLLGSGGIGAVGLVFAGVCVASGPSGWILLYLMNKSEGKEKEFSKESFSLVSDDVEKLVCAPVCGAALGAAVGCYSSQYLVRRINEHRDRRLDKTLLSDKERTQWFLRKDIMETRAAFFGIMAGAFFGLGTTLIFTDKEV